MKNLTPKIIRIIDTILSFILIILFLPLMIIVSVCIKLTSFGPVFFIQYRRGYKAKKIKIIKFRTMKVGSEKLEYKIIKEKKEPNVQTANDDRVTHFGKILRKTSIDELPQLFSIFTGKMSFVGPRPIIELEYKMLTKEQKRRFNVIPGLSGIAQVSGRSELPVQEAFKKDLEWVQIYSFKNYIIVLVKTAFFFLRKDAY